MKTEDWVKIFVTVVATTVAIEIANYVKEQNKRNAQSQVRGMM